VISIDTHSPDLKPANGVTGHGYDFLPAHGHPPRPRWPRPSAVLSKATANASVALPTNGDGKRRLLGLPVLNHLGSLNSSALW